MKAARWLVLIVLVCTGCAQIPLPTKDQYWTDLGFQVAAPEPQPKGDACEMLVASVCAYDVRGTIDEIKGIGAKQGNGAQFCPALPEKIVGLQTGYAPLLKNERTPRDTGYVALLSPTKVVLAFRGTLPPGSDDFSTVANDWFNDLKADPQDFVVGKTVSGKVHLGFWRAYKNISEPLLKAIKDWERDGLLRNDYKLYITGHSKGGAMALIAAADLAGDYPIGGVYTYAAARAGDTGFAEAFKVLPVVRYENQDDVVPHLPPTRAELEALQLIEDPRWGQLAADLDYRSFGDLIYITNNLKLITPGEREADLNHARAELFKTNAHEYARHFRLVKTISYAHSSAAPATEPPAAPPYFNRYWRAVCGNK